MAEPRAVRPFMPGYGIADGPDGMLPWSWAVRRLEGSHDYWLATVCPDGRPHVMPVWGAWLDDAVWFSTGLRSRKARNVAADARCVVTTDDARHPVILEGRARTWSEPARIRRFLSAINAKYGTDIGEDFLDPAVNGVFEVPPACVFALDEEDFDSTPTRWEFPT